jgi:hypothetical protein
MARSSRHCARPACWAESPLSTTLGPLVGEDPFDLEAGDAFEVAHVPGDQLQSVLDGGRGDLYVGISKAAAVRFEKGGDAAVLACRSAVVGQDGHGGKDPRFDVGQMAVTAGRAERAAEELTDRDGAAVLLCPGDRGKPLEIAGAGTRLEELRDRVGVEEVWHLPRSWHAARAAARVTSQPFGEGARSRPAAGHGSQARAWPCGAQALEIRQIACWHQSGDRFAVAGDDDGFASFAGTQVVAEVHFGLGRRYHSGHIGQYDRFSP